MGIKKFSTPILLFLGIGLFSNSGFGQAPAVGAPASSADASAQAQQVITQRENLNKCAEAKRKVAAGLSACADFAKETILSSCTDCDPTAAAQNGKNTAFRAGLPSCQRAANDCNPCSKTDKDCKPNETTFADPDDTSDDTDDTGGKKLSLCQRLNSLSEADYLSNEVKDAKTDHQKATDKVQKLEDQQSSDAEKLQSKIADIQQKIQDAQNAITEAQGKMQDESANLSTVTQQKIADLKTQLQKQQAALDNLNNSKTKEIYAKYIKAVNAIKNACAAEAKQSQALIVSNEQRLAAGGALQFQSLATLTNRLGQSNDQRVDKSYKAMYDRCITQTTVGSQLDEAQRAYSVDLENYQTAAQGLAADIEHTNNQIKISLGAAQNQSASIVRTQLGIVSQKEKLIVSLTTELQNAQKNSFASQKTTNDRLTQAKKEEDKYNKNYDKASQTLASLTHAKPPIYPKKNTSDDPGAARLEKDRKALDEGNNALADLNEYCKEPGALDQINQELNNTYKNSVK